MSAIGSVMVMVWVFYFLGVVSVRTCSAEVSGFGAAVLVSGLGEPRRPVLFCGVAQGRPCRTGPLAPSTATMRDESSISHHHDDFVIPGSAPLCANSRRQMRHRPNLR